MNTSVPPFVGGAAGTREMATDINRHQKCIKGIKGIKTNQNESKRIKTNQKKHASESQKSGEEEGTTVLHLPQSKRIAFGFVGMCQHGFAPLQLEIHLLRRKSKPLTWYKWKSVEEWCERVWKSLKEFERVWESLETCVRVCTSRQW